MKRNGKRLDIIIVGGAQHDRVSRRDRLKIRFLVEKFSDHDSI